MGKIARQKTLGQIGIDGLIAEVHDMLYLSHWYMVCLQRLYLLCLWIGENLDSDQQLLFLIGRKGKLYGCGFDFLSRIVNLCHSID